MESSNYPNGDIDPNWKRSLDSFLPPQLKPSSSTRDHFDGNNSRDNFLQSVSSVFDTISNQSPTFQVCTGGFAGFTAGYIFRRLAKIALFGLGGGLVIFSLAYSQGYLKIEKSSLKNDISTIIDKTQKRVVDLAKSEVLSDDSIISFYEKWAPNIHKFLRSNMLFLSGSGGGFLMALVI